MGETVGPRQKEIEREILPRIRLEFFRHDRKESGPDDFRIPLNLEGRRNAVVKGKERRSGAKRALAYSSPRDRTKETALRNVVANEPWVTEDMDLQALTNEIQARQKVGRKIIVSDSLDFVDQTEDPRFTKESDRRYDETQDWIRFFVEDSDKLVVDLKDDQDYSYSRLAGNIAELILKYVKMYPVVERVLSKPASQKDRPDTKEMQRFFASHQSVLESFLLKVIDKMEGREAARDFIEAMPDKNGFDFDEGFSVLINNDKDVTIRYRDQEWLVPVRVLEEIVHDKDELLAVLQETKDNL